MANHNQDYADGAKPSAFGVGYTGTGYIGLAPEALRRHAIEDFEARKLALDMALRVPDLDTDAAIVKRAQMFYGFLRGGDGPTEPPAGA